MGYHPFYKNHIFDRHLRFFYGKQEGDIRGVSRKTKKALIGKRMGRTKLRARLNDVVITETPYPEAALISDWFCPKCGCELTRSTGNMVEYPELWSRSYCARCRFLVSEADNGRDVHCLEYKEYGYKIDF